MPRIFRFLKIAIPFFGLLIVLVSIGALVNDRVHGAIGFLLAVVTGLSLGIGVLSLYHGRVGWLNLQIVRRHNEPLLDGKVVAFSGFVRTDVVPLISPFKKTICAVYTYTVSVHSSLSGDSKIRWLAEGCHMVKTRIEGSDLSLKLASFPDLYEFQDNLKGQEWADKTRELTERLSTLAPFVSEWEGRSRILEIKSSNNIEEIGEDYYATKYNDFGGLSIEEGALPMDQEVCVIGTYNEASNSLSSRRHRLGSNLIVYRGSAEEVIVQLGQDVEFLSKVVKLTLGIGLLIAGFAALPTEWSSKIPIIGLLIIHP